MEIRFANNSDKISVVRSIQNKKISYITSEQLKKDIDNHNMIIAIENNKIIGGLSIVHEPEHGYYAIKRACIYNNKNKGKGIISALFSYAFSLNLYNYGCTPWSENKAIIHILEKNGLQYRFTVCEKYNVYTLNP